MQVDYSPGSAWNKKSKQIRVKGSRHSDWRAFGRVQGFKRPEIPTQNPETKC